MAPKTSISKHSKKRTRIEQSTASPPSQSTVSSRSSTLQPPLGMTTAEKERFREGARKKIIKSHFVINWDVLGAYGLKIAMERLIGDGPWYKLFSIEEEAHKQTTIAFLSTFKVKKEYVGNLMNNEVEFFADGQKRTYDFYNFIRAMGIYTVEEMDHEDFNDLPVTLLTATSSSDF